MFDAAIIGSGPAGYACAIRISQLGGKAVIIEKDSVGGVCTNSGCIPKLSLHATARVLGVLKKSQDFGIDSLDYKLNFERVMKRKDRIVSASVMGIKKLIESYEIELVSGTAQIKSAKEVVVKETGKKIAARNILIATGSIPASIPGLNGMTSSDMFALKKLPEKLVIVGAGYIGVEFATTFAKFGSKVTVLDIAPHVLPNEDEDVAAALQTAMERSGIKLYMGISAIKSDGRAVSFTHGSEKVSVKGDAVLVAVGRKPNFDSGELDRLEIVYDKKGIKSDRGMKTSVPGIFAAGDVTGIDMLAHVAYQQGITAAENMMGLPTEIDYDSIPHVAYSTPEVASVGKLDKTCPISKFPLAASGAARAYGMTEGFVKVNSCDGRITSVSIVADNAGDLIAEAVLAIRKGVTLKEMERIIHAHPTMPEAFMEAVESVLGHSIHMPKNQKP